MLQSRNGYSRLQSELKVPVGDLPPLRSSLRNPLPLNNWFHPLLLWHLASKIHIQAPIFWTATKLKRASPGIEKVDVGSRRLLNLVETLWFLMLSDSPKALATEYVGAKPSSRISHCACLCRGYFGLFQNPILSPISQNASLLCLHFWLSGEMRGTNFSEILAAVEHNWTGVGYCPQCLVLGGHLRNAQEGDRTNRPFVATLQLGDPMWHSSKRNKKGHELPTG